ncbi:MAG: hypothetical protein ACLQU2_03330 [Candidatus Binataceae bacterium]
MKRFLHSTGLQNILLFLTLAAAVCIGLKQNEIGRKQNEINRNLLDLNYYPQIELSYNQQTGHATVRNVGKVQVCIYEIGPTVPDPDKPIQADCISSGSWWSVPSVPAGGSPCCCAGPSPFFVFLKNQDDKRYTVKFLFFCEGTKVADSRAQTVGSIPDWRTF